jgi:hypothetical protein
MAFGAIEMFLFMNIRRDAFIFSEIFFFDTTAVAAGADGLHGRLLNKPVSVEQAAANITRATDMTLTAATVATITMCI